MKARSPRIRAAHKVLAMLAGNGGSGVVKVGYPRVMVLGPPDRQHAQAPAATVTYLALSGLVLLSDGGMLHLTDDGRTECARLGIDRRPRNPRQAAMARAAVGLMAARNGIDEIFDGALQLPAEIPPHIQARINRLRTEAAELWEETFALAHGERADRKVAA